jgi:hypothetical protein
MRLWVGILIGWWLGIACDVVWYVGMRHRYQREQELQPLGVDGLLLAHLDAQSDAVARRGGPASSGTSDGDEVVA